MIGSGSWEDQRSRLDRGVVEHVRRVGSGLNDTPMKSTTLLLDSFAPLTGDQEVTSIDAEWERVTVDDPCNPATTPKCFSHVEVTLP